MSKYKGEDGFDYEECIHIKACRRLCKIARGEGKNITRYCSRECSAYEVMDYFLGEWAPQYGYYTEDEVEKVKYGACMDGKRGYYPEDILISDFV